ncbi:MAG: amidohydrolase family protein [Planctomycetaceae bacterium]|nr:amidohydrolase family protein [Planctomycetaceae bacterium]
MTSVAWVEGTVVLPNGLLPNGIVLANAGKIVAVGDRVKVPKGAEVVSAKGRLISPGFVDIHVHGGGGADFMDGTVDAIRVGCRSHLRHGTTSIFPTTTTGSYEEIHAMIRACQDAKLSTIRGVHLYGPYFAENKVGCHSVAGRRNPERTEYESYFETGMIRIATCAAELPAATEFYKAARKNRCFITCGHSNASWSEMKSAFKAGMRHVDHFWCAMSSVPSVRERFGTPMQGSMTEFVLMNRDMSTEVIADGEHLAPELLEFAYQMLGPNRLCLVTDCNRALDMPIGRYRFGNIESGTWLESDGNVGRALSGSLASSVVGMDSMIRHFKEVTTASLSDVIRMASLTPAERTSISKKYGSLEVGKSADVLILSKKLHVERVFVSGVEQII